MKKTTLLSLSLFFSLFLVLQSCGSLKTTDAPKGPKHTIWKITDTKTSQEGYLVGSVHLAKPELYPLDSLYYAKMDQASVVGFEIRLDSMMIESQTLLPQLGFYPMEESLKDHLPDSTYQKVIAKSSELGLPSTMIDRMKPWVVSTTLTAMELQKAGYMGDGIDKHFFDRAKKQDKEMISLESTEYQMSVFADMTDEEQVAFLEYSLDSADESVESIDQIMEYWKVGDAEEIAALMDSSMEDYSEEMNDKLLIQRNKNWIPKIQKLIQQDKKPFIIVGVGHLVGEDSVVDLLKKEGYKVEQL